MSWTCYDEEPTNKLQKEIDRREASHQKGVCPYCNVPYKDHTCKYAYGKEENFHKAVPKK